MPKRDREDDEEEEESEEEGSEEEGSEDYEEEEDESIEYESEEEGSEEYESEEDEEYVPVLWQLIERKEWKEVSERLSSHPEEAKFRNEATWRQATTCVAKALSEKEHPPPLEIVQALIRAGDTSAELLGEALHRACNAGQSDEVIELILQEQPYAARCIIHHLGCLAFNQSFYVDKTAYALARLVKSPKTAKYKIGDAIVQQEPAAARIWNKVCMLAKAHYYGSLSLEDGETFQLLHAFVGCTKFMDTLDYIRLAIKLHPEQLTEPDRNGNLPLHIATMSPCCNEPMSCNDKTDTNGIVLLLAAYPQAARIRNKQDKLPIQLALDSGDKEWKGGLEDLYKAFPIKDDSVLEAIPETFRDLAVRHSSTKSMDPYVNVAHRLCFACTKSKPFAIHFCQAVPGLDRSLNRHCVECTKALGHVPECNCCGQNHLRTLTNDAASHILGFLDLPRASSFRSACRQLHALDSAFRLCGLLKPLGYSGNCLSYESQLKILERNYRRDLNVLSDVIANRTASGGLLRDLLLVAVKQDDAASTSLLLGEAKCQVDGVLDKALRGHKEHAIAVLIQDDRVKEKIVICAYCAENVACADCKHKYGGGFTFGCTRGESMYQDRFCIACAADSYCYVCESYQCRECNDYLDREYDVAEMNEIIRSCKRCGSCGQLACKVEGFNITASCCFRECLDCERVECNKCVVPGESEWTSGYCPDCGAE